MTILRMDLQSGGWRAVSPRIFEDQRLSLDTRAVAGYISTRSDSFSLSVSGLCSLLNIGEDKWRRINKELSCAGYLKLIKGKDDRGRFHHELVFSPIPNGGFPEKSSEKLLCASPKIPGRPGTGNPGTGKPCAADTEATIEQIDQISDHHHQQQDGLAGQSNSTIPPVWTEAANYEIFIEEQARPIRNRSGLFQSIINRYRTNGGPDSFLMTALKRKLAAEARQKVHDEAILDRLRQEEEQVRISTQRHAEAEKKAKMLNSSHRAKILSNLEEAAPIKASELARTEFIQHGQVNSGALSKALVDYLVALNLDSLDWDR